jgi:hypothetical protein
VLGAIEPSAVDYNIHRLAVHGLERQPPYGVLLVHCWVPGNFDVAVVLFLVG